MEKKKKQLILIGILVPVLGLVLYNSLSTVAEKKKKGRARTTAPQAVQPVEAPAAAPAPNADSGELPPLNEKLAQMQNTIAEEPWGRDPFHPPPVELRDKPSTNWKEFKLTGVIPGRAATINGEPIRIGEEFEGYLLIKVEDYRIILEKTGRSYTITMPED